MAWCISNCQAMPAKLSNWIRAARALATEKAKAAENSRPGAPAPNIGADPAKHGGGGQLLENDHRRVE